MRLHVAIIDDQPDTDVAKEFVAWWLRAIADWLEHENDRFGVALDKHGEEVVRWDYWEDG